MTEEQIKPKPRCPYCLSGNVYFRNIYELTGLELCCRRCGKIQEQDLKIRGIVTTTKRPRFVYSRRHRVKKR